MISLEKMVRLSRGALGLWGLFWVAFFESTVLIFPVELMLIALSGVTKYRWYVLSLIATTGSVLGGILGYVVGGLAWDPLATSLLESVAGVDFVMVGGVKDIVLPSYITHVLGLSQPSYLMGLLSHWNSWIVAVFAFTPLPYRIVTMASGAAGSHLGVFVLASFLARGLRYSLVAWLVNRCSLKGYEQFKKAVFIGALTGLVVVFCYFVYKLWLLQTAVL